jgi:hypothetical protein
VIYAEHNTQRRAEHLTLLGLQTPLGPWPADRKFKEIGQYAKLALEQDIEGRSMISNT